MSTNPLLSASLRPGHVRPAAAPPSSSSRGHAPPVPSLPRPNPASKLGAPPVPQSNIMLLPGGHAISRPTSNPKPQFGLGASASSRGNASDEPKPKAAFGALLQDAIKKTETRPNADISRPKSVSTASKMHPASAAASKKPPASSKEEEEGPSAKKPPHPAAAVVTGESRMNHLGLSLKEKNITLKQRDPFLNLESCPQSEASVSQPQAWNRRAEVSFLSYDGISAETSAELTGSMQSLSNLKSQGAEVNQHKKYAIGPVVSSVVRPIGAPPAPVDPRSSLRPGEVSNNYVRLNLKRKRSSPRSKREFRAPLSGSEEEDGGFSDSDGESSVEGAQKKGPGGSSETKAGFMGSLPVDPLQLCLLALDGETQARGNMNTKREISAAEKTAAFLRRTNTPLFRQTETATVCNEVLATAKSSKTTTAKKAPLRDLAKVKNKRATGPNDNALVDDEWLTQLAPKCAGHSMPAKLLRVKKAGPNKGRRFYGCTFPQDQRCKFFMWAEDNPDLVGIVVKENKWNISSAVAQTSTASTEPVTSDPSDDLWRRFAIEKYCDKLRNLDLLSLKSEIRARRRTHRYWSYMRANNFSLSGNKNELIKKLVDEAFAFLQTEDILYDKSDLIAQYDDLGCSSGPSDESDAEKGGVTDSDGDTSDDSKSDDEIRPRSKARGKSVSKGKLSLVEHVATSKTVSSNDDNDDDSDVMVLSDSDESCSSKVSVGAILNDHRETVGVPSLCGALQRPSPATMMSVDRVRQLCFGFDEFKPGQRWAIERVLGGKNSLLVIPTGSGKSLSFFLPALILGGGARAALPGGDPGLTIVVSPLISIMNDQLMRLPVHLPGAIFSSGMTAVESANLTFAILSGMLRILFVSPERLCTASFRNLMRLLKRKRRELGSPNADRPVALFCVDEAHCLSQWSFNFRPSFLRIKREISYINPRAVLALTATASATVQKDIMSHLGIVDDGVYALPPARYNLSLAAKRTDHNAEARNEVVLQYLVENLSLGSQATSQPRRSHVLTDNSKRRFGASIVYVWRRNDAEVLAEFLQSSGVRAAAYHAGMDAQQRLKTQNLFMRGSFDVVVATIAFGMGLDKANVRCVIHTSAPKSVENYIQEIGRAGRDGKSSKCFLVMDKTDTISQYSLSFSTRVSTYQIYLFVSLVFEPIYKELINYLGKHDSNDASKSENAMLCFMALDKSWSGEGAQLRVALSPSLIRNRTDLSDSVIDTLIAILELSPFKLLEVDGTRLDTICGKYRDISSAVDINTKDSIETGIIRLNQLKAGGIKPKSDFPVNGSYFDTPHVPIGNFDSDMTYESYGFKVSLMDLSNHLRMDPDQVSCALFAKQKQGIISYTISEPAVYCSLSRQVFSTSFRSFLETSPQQDLSSAFDAWLRDLAASISSVVAKATDDAAARVLDMWRVSTVIADHGVSTESSDKSVDADGGASQGMTGAVTSDSGASADSVMDFLCLYMSKLSDGQGLSSADIIHSITVGPLSCLVDAYYKADLPIIDVGTKEGDAIESQIRSDVIAVLAHPGLADTFQSLEASSGRASSAEDKAEFMSIYTARVLHGLSTDRLAALDLAGGGGSSSRWGSRRDVNFNAIVRIARGFLPSITDK